MTRLTTIWTGTLLALTGTAMAQSADPYPPVPPADPPDTTTTDTTPDDTTTGTTTDTPTPTTTTTDTVNDGTTTDRTAPADLDINVDMPDPQRSTYVVAPTPVVIDDDTDDWYDYDPVSGVGIAISAGGGASGFTNDTLRGTTDVGGAWDVRATVGTRSPIAFEGSYIGSAQGIDALGLDTDAVLVGNGVQGALRLNGTLDLPVQPFLYAGAAWRRYDLTNTSTNFSDVAGSDDVLEIPMGVGIAGTWNGLIFDLRGEFRASTDEDLLPEFAEDEVNVDPSFADMHRWGVTTTVGMEF